MSELVVLLRHGPVDEEEIRHSEVRFNKGVNQEDREALLEAESIRTDSGNQKAELP